MTANDLTAAKAAYRLTHVLNAIVGAHGLPRFPIDVAELAKEAANIFHWADPISQVQAAALRSFEGALYPDDGRQKWLLLYNDKLTSPGRIRFTQAHELGHYLLHRERRERFECSEDDMVNWDAGEANIEAQADSFASTLLMPLDDFREQVGTGADFDVLGQVASRYGVSLTAATLRWLGHTDANAILVVHRDGFIDWASSSPRAMRAGAFFKSRRNLIAVPDDSLAANNAIPHERLGKTVDARIWFPHADKGLSLKEMKLSADQYDSVMTLLVLPRSARVWPEFDRYK